MQLATRDLCLQDNSNFVIDAVFDEAHMREPDSLLTKLKMLTGVVEVGLFIGMARCAYFGNEDGSVTVRWSDGQEETLHEGQQPSISVKDVDTERSLKEELLTVDLEERETQEEEKLVTSNDAKAELNRKLEQLRMTST